MKAIDAQALRAKVEAAVDDLVRKSLAVTGSPSSAITMLAGAIAHIAQLAQEQGLDLLPPARMAAMGIDQAREAMVRWTDDRVEARAKSEPS